LRLFSFRDGYLKRELRERLGEFLWFRSHQREANQAATRGGVGSRVRGVGAPFNEKRQQAGSIGLQIERVPLQQPAVGTLA